MGDGFQFIDIIFFAMIAAFLVLRLRSVLGRRDGHEGGYHDPFKGPKAKAEAKNKGKAEDDNVVHLPDRSEAGAEAETAESPWDVADEAAAETAPRHEGVLEILRADPNFDPDEFIAGAKVAFEMILGAYATGDTQTLESLLSSEVFANFEKAIRDREQAGETLEDTLVGIKSAEIVEAYVEDKMASVVIKFISQQINVTRNENGDVVDGDPNMVIDVTDFWTFARNVKSRDPNWTLVATGSLD